MWDFYHLTVHPDGTRLAFTSYGSAPKHPEIWVMDNFLPNI
jgi:hypothetical protein